MTTYSAVSSILTAYLDKNLPVCEDLLRVLHSVCVPSRPHLFQATQPPRPLPFRFAECVVASSGDLVVYPRVLSSTDGVWEGLASLVGTSAAETGVYRAIHGLLAGEVARAECWRALVTVDAALGVAVTVSDMFRHSALGEAQKRDIQLDKGRLWVGTEEYKMQGNFIYSFVNKVLRLSDSMYVYCEGGVLLSIHIDSEKRVGKVEVVNTHGYSAINTFVYTQDQVGVILCGSEAFAIGIMDKTLNIALTPVRGNKKFPVSACVTNSLSLCLTLCGRGSDQGEVVQLHPVFFTDFSLC